MHMSGNAPWSSIGRHGISRRTLQGSENGPRYGSRLGARAPIREYISHGGSVLGGQVTTASLAIEDGEPLHRLRDRLGHSSVLITSRYLHTSMG